MINKCLNIWLIYIYSDNLCTFGNETNPRGIDVGTACQGDSGGPLIIEEQKKYKSDFC